MIRGVSQPADACRWPRAAALMWRISIMWRSAIVIALGVLIGQGQPARAQSGLDKNTIRQLQADLDALRRQVERVEGRLKAVQGSTKAPAKGQPDFLLMMKGF